MTQDSADSGDDLHRAFVHFITAFNNMDLRWLGDVLAEEITLFAPAGPSGLVAGHPAVLSHFDRVFAAEPPAGPNVQPINLQLKKVSEAAALVTFEFARAQGSVGRRTLVFTRVQLNWMVSHIHASNT